MRKAGYFYLAVVLGILAFCMVMIGCAKDLPIARDSVTSYGWITSDQVVVAATGTAGSATGSGSTDSLIKGHLYAVHLDFTGTISNTTDITITQASPSLTVLQLTNYYTDTWYYPVAQQTDNAGSGTSTYDQLPVVDQLDISVGQTSVNASLVTVTVYWGE